MERKRVALVTGGAKGIGKAIALKLADAGFSLAINYRTSEKEANELVSYLQSRGVNALAICADVSKRDEVKKMYETCKAYFGFVDTVINNAGVSQYKMFCDCTDEDYDFVMNNNLRSVVNVCSFFSPDMVSNNFGRIVNISSVWGEQGASMEVLYSASKAGVIGLSKALNAELAPSGVIVNAVTPGFIDTDMNAHLSTEDVDAFTQSISVGRIGKPSEVADVVELLTRRDLYIAGAVIPVNGGLL
ncbi:MAG: 3-oxoacyl-ACP reductase FabG [Clostridia bacterium]|nr:3-oxoacyl-ACP reductase FabG [Clostridia bacterium]